MYILDRLLLLIPVGVMMKYNPICNHLSSYAGLIVYQPVNKFINIGLSHFPVTTPSNSVQDSGMYIYTMVN